MPLPSPPLPIIRPPLPPTPPGLSPRDQRAGARVMSSVSTVAAIASVAGYPRVTTRPAMYAPLPPLPPRRPPSSRCTCSCSSGRAPVRRVHCRTTIRRHPEHRAASDVADATTAAGDALFVFDERSAPPSVIHHGSGRAHSTPAVCRRRGPSAGDRHRDREPRSGNTAGGKQQVTACVIRTVCASHDANFSRWRATPSHAGLSILPPRPGRQALDH